MIFVAFLFWLVYATTANQKCLEALEEKFNQTMLTLYRKHDYPDSVEMFMYNGKGINDLGHYRGCLRKHDKYYLLHQVFYPNNNIFVGLCVPKECSEKDIENDLYGLLKYDPDDINKSFSLTVESKFEFSLGIGGIFTIFLIIGLLIICGFATYIDNKNYFDNTKNSSLEIWRNFSISANLSRLFTLRKLKKGDNINVLDSLRVLSISWVISAHVFGFYSLRIVTNMIELPDIAGKLWVAFIYGGFFAVDSFFFFSGFLLGYLLLKDIEQKRGELGFMSWVIRNVHRYFRLIPLYAFLMLFFNTVWLSMGNGPIWSFIKDYNIKQCENYWWTNFLFLNNFIPDGKGNQCFGVGWYLANDMQFFIVGQLFIILYYKIAKWLAWILNLLIVIAGVTIGITIAAEYNLKTNILDPNMDYDMWEEVFYKKPYTRFLPYFIGILIGFVYLRYSKQYVNKEEDTHHDPACTLIIKNIRDTKFGAIISFCVGLAVILFLILIQRQVYKDLTNSYVWTNGENAVFLGTCRLGFAIGLSMILLPLLLGRLRFIYKILTFRFWGYLAKISYAVYLCHMGVIIGVFGNNEGSTILTETLFVKHLIFFNLVSWPVALILWLIIEEPSSLMERLLIGKLIKRSK